MWNGWKNTKRLFALLILAGLAAQVARAQAPDRSSPPSGGQQSPAGNPSGSAAGVSSNSNFFESATGLEGQRRLFDTDSDSVDWENGVVHHKGKTFNIGQSRLMRARFERYLMVPVVREDVEEYQAILQTIQDKISPNNNRLSSDSLMEAWGLLSEASAYEIDGGNSLVIANLVYNVWRMRDEFEAASWSRIDLERERDDQQDVVANRARMLQRQIEQQQKLESRRGEDGAAGITTENYDGPDETAFRALDLAETEASIKNLELNMAATALEAKVQYQMQIVNFIFQRRFQHALIACQFYRTLFKGSAQQLTEEASAELTQFVPSTNAAYSIDALEYMAREAMNDVDKGIASVNNAYERKQGVMALERLQETFFLGEHLLPVQLFDEEKKADLLSIYQKSRSLQKLLDLKDYQEVVNVTEGLQKVAEDFPALEVKSGVKSAMQASNMALFGAQQALAGGEMEKYEENLSKSREIWPLNPKLDEFMNTLRDKSDVSLQASIQFDEIMKHGSKRQIYENRAEFGGALMNDAGRSEKLKEIVVEVGNLDFLIAQAENFIEQDQPYAAWETLAKATQYDPDDSKLNKVKAELAVRVGTFVQKLDAAQRMEEQGNYATSLINYLAAQDMYPVSVICHEGIERVSRKLIQKVRDNEGGDQSSAASSGGSSNQG